VFGDAPGGPARGSGGRRRKAKAIADVEADFCAAQRLRGLPARFWKASVLELLRREPGTENVPAAVANALRRSSKARQALEQMAFGVARFLSEMDRSAWIVAYAEEGFILRLRCVDARKWFRALCRTSRPFPDSDLSVDALLLRRTTLYPFHPLIGVEATAAQLRHLQRSTRAQREAELERAMGRTPHAILGFSARARAFVDRRTICSADEVAAGLMLAIWVLGRYGREAWRACSAFAKATLEDYVFRQNVPWLDAMRRTCEDRVLQAQLAATRDTDTNRFLPGVIL